MESIKLKSFRPNNSLRLPKMVRSCKKINITKKEAGEIIKKRVQDAQINPPNNWNKWNINNVILLDELSVNYFEYNRVLGKSNDNDYPFVLHQVKTNTVLKCNKNNNDIQFLLNHNKNNMVLKFK
jgi:hypothetical protein